MQLGRKKPARDGERQVGRHDVDAQSGGGEGGTNGVSGSDKNTKLSEIGKLGGGIMSCV